MKSALAFRFTCEAAFKRPKVFLWTFTFKRSLNVEKARKLWSEANNRFRKSGVLVGLRAFEMHPGGHGLHIHMVTETFVPVQLVRRIWTGAATDYEGGRIHVEAVPVERATYIGKYLTKKRPECLKGARLWASVGGLPSSKVKDIVRECGLTRAYALCRAMWEGFDGLPFKRRMSVVRAVWMNELLIHIGDKPHPLPVAI